MSARIRKRCQAHARGSRMKCVISRPSLASAKKRAVPLLALLIVGVASATPAPTGLTTIDPSSFPLGENVSNVTPGVTLYDMTLVPTTHIAYGEWVFKPQLGPVFAQEGVNVYGFGNDELFTRGTFSYNSGLWDSMALETGYELTTDCLKKCDLINSGYTPSTGYVPSFLDISFKKPVNFVSVLQYSNAYNYALAQAFNKQGKLIGYCAAAGQGGSGPGCVATDLNPPIDAAIWQFTFSDPSADISTLIVSSGDMGDQIGKIQFGTISTPEPTTLGLMFLGLAGVGFALRRRKNC